MPGYQVPLTTVDANTTINNQKLVTTGNDIGKNYLINGDFSIWQRGTSFTGAGFTADRWHVHDGSASVVITKTADGISLSGTSSAFAAGNTFHGLEYRGIESQDIYNVLSSGPMTFSWKMKSTVNATIAIRMDLFDSNGTRHSYTPLISVSQSTTFVKYSVVIPQNSIVTKRNNEQGFQPQFVFVESRPSYLGGSATEWNSPATKLVPQLINAFAGGNATFEITEVQLEKGSVPTPFWRRPFGQELALCQRYYHRVSGTTYTPLTVGGYTQSTTDCAWWVPLPVSMRVAPTALEFSGSGAIAFRSGNNGSGYTIGNLTIGSSISTPTLARGGGSISSGTWVAFHSGYLEGNGGPCYLGFSAEL
jgi:hypothetical protein